MKYRLSQYALDVIKARCIKEIWIENTIETPVLKVVKAEDELNLFATIPANENRCLKIVLNPISMIVVIAYFDGNMRKKGCK